MAPGIASLCNLLYQFLQGVASRGRIASGSSSILFLQVLLLPRLMQTSLNGEDVRTQELPLILTTISKNFEGHLYAWGFVKENWDKIIKK